MFTLDLEPFYPWPVKIGLPYNGSTKEFTFTIHFARLDTDEVQALMQEINDRNSKPVEDDGSEPNLLTDKELCRKIVHGWGADLQDGSKKAVPFSEDNLDKLLKVFGAPAAIVNAWFEAMFPQVKAESGKGMGKQP